MSLRRIGYRFCLSIDIIGEACERSIQTSSSIIYGVSCLIRLGIKIVYILLNETFLLDIIFMNFILFVSFCIFNANILDVKSSSAMSDATLCTY